MTEENTKPVYSQHVVEMLTVANEYCMFVEKAEEYTKKDIVEYMHKILPMLYLKGILTPATNVEDPSANEKYVNEMQWERIFYNIKGPLGDDDKYWIVRNTGLNEYEPQEASLADNLADIYQDMKDFLMLYQRNSDAAKENAVADFKNHFQNHWGVRALRAANRFHELMYNPDKDPFADENKLGLE